MAWTAQQEKALEARGRNILLSASAGSGKTAVLTERITRLVSDPSNHISINDLLVLTFTNAAAGEMRSRITASLSQKLQEADEKGNREEVLYLEKQISLAGSSQISTLDSFFQSLIHQYFYLLDLDPQARLVSDDNEIFLFMQDVMDIVLERWYEKGDPDFLKTADLFSSRYQDSRLKEIILSLYRYARSLPFPEYWLSKLPKAYQAGSRSLDDLPWAKPVLESIKENGAAIAALYRQMFQLMTTEPDLQHVYGDVYSNEYAYFTQLENLTSWDDFYSMGEFTPVTIRTNTKAVKEKITDPDHFKEIKSLLASSDRKGLHDEAIKKYKDKIEPFRAVSQEKWLEETFAMEPVVSVLSRLAVDFSKTLSQAKKQENIMDFGDLEHFALELLIDKNAPGFTPEKANEFPSEAALDLRKKYKEILIDEYQDTNRVQELITDLISNGKNRFMVGDVKQSIYRFRLADPSIFLEKYHTYDKESGKGQRIDLNQNFRSDAVILSGINFLFRQFMTPETLELSYSDTEALYPGRHEEKRPASYAGGSISIELIDEKDVKKAGLDETKVEMNHIRLEGRMIARNIRHLLDSHAQVENKDGSFRPLRYSDIVILLRSAAGKSPELVKTLQQAGIPATADQDDDYLKSTEVMVLWALLKILDNPRQDLAMTAVLRSYFCGLSEKDLALLHLAEKEEKKEALIDILPHASDLLSSISADKVSRFLDHYVKWRKQSLVDGMAPLIRTIIDDTDYLSYVSGLPNEEFRTGHIEAFYELALSRDQTTQKGLYRFLNDLTRLSQAGRAVTAVSSVALADTVRIMTIHKSKGLEFPVVFLADAAKSFNTRSLTDIALFHRTLGLGIEYFDESHRLRWPSLYWLAVKTMLYREGAAEEARLLYVAMTRARDKLFITGICNDLEKSLRSWAAPLTFAQQSAAALPAFSVSSAKSYLDWIMPAALRHRTMKDAWKHIDQVPSYIDDAPYDHSLFDFHAIKQQELFTSEELQIWKDQGGALPEKLVEKREKAKEQEGILHFLDTPSAIEVPEWMKSQLSWQYPYASSTTTPAKLTATGATRLLEERENSHADVAPLPSSVMVPDEAAAEEGLPDGFSSPAFLSPHKIASSGTSYGTLMHKAMYLIDWTKAEPDEAYLTGKINELTEKGLLSKEEGQRLLSNPRRRAIHDFMTFLHSPVPLLMKDAQHIRKEMPFSILLPASHFYPDSDSKESIFMQGVMDLLLEMKDGLIIIDYKTDHHKTAEELAERYGLQLRIYGDAGASLFQKPVKDLYLWSFALGKLIPVVRK